jgi:hypothetical protein
MKTKLVLLIAISLVFTSCSLVEKVNPSEKLSGTQSPQGEIGNTFTSGGVSGINVSDAKVSDLTDGVSTIKVKLKLTDQKLKSWAGSFPYSNSVNGDEVEIEFKVRMTENGIQTVFPDGNLTLVKYDGKVGDTYTAKINGKNAKREITYKSTSDDYSYAFFNIKVIEVEETGFGLPGVSKIVYITNHKFGLVGIKAVFEDGSEKKVYVISKNDN